MLRFFAYALSMLLLYVTEASFIYALPHPLSSIPIVLVVSIFLYQYKMQRTQLWWFIGFGFFLDLLGVSISPFEIFSHAIAACVLYFLAERVFTNRSYYGMAATSIVVIFFLCCFRLVVWGVLSVVDATWFSLHELVVFHLWSAFFSSILFLFVVPIYLRCFARTKAYVARVLQL